MNDPENSKKQLTLDTVETNLFDFDKPKKAKKKKSKKDKKDKKDKKKKKKSKKDKLKNFPFTYDEMLQRINKILEKNNPYGKETNKLQLQPIQFDKIGSKKFKWSNFREFASSLNRRAEHMAQFVGAGLGIEPILQEEALLMEGRRFDKETLQTITKKYILEYIKCPYCSSTNTELYKDSSIREYIMKCNACQSKKTMTAIKGGNRLGKKK